MHPGAALTALREDGTFKWDSAGDTEANRNLTLCLRQKGYRITP